MRKNRSFLLFSGCIKIKQFLKLVFCVQNGFTIIAAGIFLLKISNWNIRGSSDKSVPEWQQKQQNDINDVVLVSLLLILNRSHTFFWCFHHWFWTSNCQLELSLSNLTIISSLVLQMWKSDLKSLICTLHTPQKMKFTIKEIFSKCDQIYRKLRIWSGWLKKSLMENFNFCAVV